MFFNVCYFNAPVKHLEWPYTAKNMWTLNKAHYNQTHAKDLIQKPWAIIS